MNKISIAEFTGKNGAVMLEVEKVEEYGQVKYYYIADNGNRSTCYSSIDQARLDMQDVYGKYKGFKLLQKEDLLS